MLQANLGIQMRLLVKILCAAGSALILAPCWWLRRLVLQDVLDLCQDLRRELRQNLNGLQIILQLLHARSAEDDGARMRRSSNPSQGKVSNGAAEFFLGKLAQFLNLLDFSETLLLFQAANSILEEVRMS